MSISLDSFIEDFDKLASISDNRVKFYTIDDTKNAIKIQSWFRGINFRNRRLPLIMYRIQKFLKDYTFECSTQTTDGRVNSCLDEDFIIDLLSKKFKSKIEKPDKSKRMWYDIIVNDNLCGWIPVNIKTTTMMTNDNTGNLAMCLYSYTDEKLIVDCKKTYTNGKVYKVLIDKLKSKNYNRINKKDYYFIVVNKTNSKDIVINSVKGLSVLTPNINNLPFQVCWDKNREVSYGSIKNKIKDFIKCIQSPEPSWSEKFLENMRSLKI
jgi:hypothetical protein